VFSGWSGDASGDASPVTVIMDRDKTVTATFALQITFDLKPHDVDLNSKGKWATGYLQPPDPYLASQIDVPSIRLNGVVAVSTEYPAKLEDKGGRLKVKFLRSDMKPTLTPGESVPVTVTGTIAGQALIGTDYIKVTAPKIHTPKAGDQLMAGAIVPVTWDVAAGATLVTLLSSLDNGATWNVEAEDIPNVGSYAWRVPTVSTPVARLEVVAVYGVDETGVIPESEFAASDGFSIQAATADVDATGAVAGAVFALRPRIRSRGRCA
jgi:hypothetical protein